MRLYQRLICAAAALGFAWAVWPTEESFLAWGPFYLLRGLAVAGLALFLLAAVRPTRPPS